MTKYRIFFTLGFFSTLPSSYFYVLLGVLYVVMLSKILRSGFKRNLSLIGFAVILLFFATVTFLGIIYGQSEAQRFLLRALICVLIVFIYLITFDGRDERLYTAYLLGVLGGIFLNGIAILIFAFSPDAYQILHIDNFSGYDKGARFLRSPGLQAGTDTAGFMSVFGIVLYLYLKQRQVTYWFVSRIFFLGNYILYDLKN